MQGEIDEMKRKIGVLNDKVEEKDKERYEGGIKFFILKIKIYIYIYKSHYFFMEKVKVKARE
jgi:hypothetical protein